MKEEHCLENTIFFSVSEANIFCPWHCVAIFLFSYNIIVLKGKTLFFFSKTILWISKSVPQEKQKNYFLSPENWTRGCSQQDIQFIRISSTERRNMTATYVQ